MLEKLARHWGLMNAMGQKTGVDLGAEFVAGTLSRDELREAVFACTKCEKLEDCEIFLAQDCVREASVPAYCRNIGLFATLKALQV